MAENYQLSGNRLKIENRARLYGLLRFVYAALAGGVCVLAVITLPLAAANAQAVFDAFENNTAGAAEVVWVAAYVVSLLGLLVGAVTAMSCFLRGLKAMLSLFIPVKVPQDLYLGAPAQPSRSTVNANTVFQDLFKHRTISTYTALPGFVARVAQLVSSRLRYATPPMHRPIRAFLGTKAIILTLLLCVPAVLSLPPLRPTFEQMVGDPELAKHVTATSVPWLLLAVVLGGRAIRLLVLLAMMPASPRVEVHEQRVHMENTGNPVNFFNHATEAVEDERVGDFPNRMYNVARPDIGTARPGETKQFRGFMLFETQPWPKKTGGALACVIAGMGGAFMGAVGLAALVLMPVNPLVQSSVYDIALWMLGGLVACVVASRLMGEARSLQLVYRFRSAFILMDFNGTYTSSEIGLGDGRGGQLHARRSAMQSDTYLTLYASSLVTECYGPKALQQQLRYIVSAEVNDDLRQLVGTLVKRFQTYADSGAALPGVRIDPSAQQMIQANAMIEEASAAAKKRGNKLGKSKHADAPQIGQTPPRQIDGEAAE
ncbi:MAG: hypothetical protein ACIAXF_08390 [Phycisphaerales bacterium JB063]